MYKKNRCPCIVSKKNVHASEDLLLPKTRVHTTSDVNERDLSDRYTHVTLIKSFSLAKSTPGNRSKAWMKHTSGVQPYFNFAVN